MPREVDAITRLYDYLLWLVPKLEKFQPYFRTAEGAEDRRIWI